MRVAVIGESPAKGFENCTPIWGVRETDGKRCATGRRWGEWAMHVGINPFDCDYFNLSTGVPDLTGYDLVVTLGAKARRYLEQQGDGVEYFPLPHPSGRNRQLNDKMRLTLMLTMLKELVQRRKNAVLGEGTVR
jgi:hypothetical protein